MTQTDERPAKHLGGFVSKPEHRQDEIDSAAAGWVARLEGAPLTPAERRAFERWLRADPAHAETLAEARAALARLDALRAAPERALRPEGPGDMPAWPPAPANDIRPKARHRRSAARIGAPAAALAACLLLFLAAGLLWFGDPAALLRADHRTAPGEIRTVALADGSTILLGPASAVAVSYSDSDRTVELLQGVAYFTAVPREQAGGRPFTVIAAGGAAQALGTRFQVERQDDSVTVTVTEHRVKVALGGSAVKLSPGQAVRYAPGALGTVRAVALEQSLAWQRGRLIFDRLPLGEAMAALNRYRHGRILIASPELAARSVSGVFDPGDPETVLRRIVDELGVESVEITPLLTVLR